MKIRDLRLHKLQQRETIPFDLLLLADEEEEAIRKYIYDAAIYTLYCNERLDPIAVVALFRVSESEIEIKNIGVLELFRVMGIGSWLIDRVKEIASKESYKEIIVGTADSGTDQIRFYERNGFVKYAIKKIILLIIIPNQYLTMVFCSEIWSCLK